MASVLTSHQQDASTFIQHCNRVQSSINLQTGPLLQQQEAYWSIVASTNINQLPKDNAQGSNRVEDTAVVDFTLNEKRTSQLLTQCYKAYQTDINDLLLAVLTLALREIFDLQNIAINLEGLL